jgi:hypothetical protein
VLLPAHRRRVGRAAAGKFARQRFDLACELAFLGGHLQDAPRDGAQREQAAAQLWITSAVWPRCREPLQEPRACERPQVRAERLRGRDQQIAQLAETGALGVDRAFPCGHQRLQRLALTACPWCRSPLVGEHAASGTDRVERVGLAARAALPTQPADLEHPLATTGEQARETGAERACPLDSEDTTPRRVLLAEHECSPIAIAVSRNIRFEHDRAGTNVDHRACMRVAVRVDTNDVVQLICEHP